MPEPDSGAPRDGVDSVDLLIRRKGGCDDVPLPRYMSDGASGMDLHAAVESDLAIQPGEIRLVPAGIFIAVPRGFEAQVRPRSGLALKHGVAVINSPGTIDSDYRGEVCVIVGNLGREKFIVKRGMRIAQLVLQRVARAQIQVVEELTETRRGEGGFGHTGH